MSLNENLSLPVTCLEEKWWIFGVFIGSWRVSMKVPRFILSLGEKYQFLGYVCLQKIIFLK